jgi:hypothetical protein
MWNVDCGMWDVGFGLEKIFLHASMQASNAQSFLSRCDEETEHGTFLLLFIYVLSLLHFLWVNGWVAAGLYGA